MQIFSLSKLIQLRKYILSPIFYRGKSKLFYCYRLAFIIIYPCEGILVFMPQCSYSTFLHDRDYDWYRWFVSGRIMITVWIIDLKTNEYKLRV